VNKNFRTVLLYLVLLAVLVWVVMASIRGNTAETKTLTTSDFVTATQQGRVAKATYVVRDNKLAGDYWEKIEAKNAKEAPKKFTSTYVGTDSLAALSSAPSTTSMLRGRARSSRSSPRSCRSCCWSW
jgi:cell division protease FtsH